MTQDTFFSLFDSPLETDNGQIDPEGIVLDPTELYDIPSGYIPITTEVEWIKFFGVSNPCWVKGARLCKWAEVWLQAWNKIDAIAQTKQDPRLRLETLFHPVPLPGEWTGKQLLTLVNRLNAYPQDKPIAHLLADITQNRDIWLGEPSIQNLAAWLAIQVPQECKPLERVWQYQIQDRDLAIYYQTEDKLLLLRRWLGIAEPTITQLGAYPLPVPDFIAAEFDSYWEQQLYHSEAKVLDSLVPASQSGMERIADCAYKVLKKRPLWINKVREAKVATYLNYQQQVDLRDRQSPPQPQPLALDASPQEALTWVTQNYLPFRRWETVVSLNAGGNRIASCHVNQPTDQKISDAIADSFVNWMLQHYPEMKVDAVDRSLLNYNVTSLVRNLCENNPVLWVVVDGLSWLDHLELLSILTKNYHLAIETAIQPRFSILPTKTKYAKWSLFAQLLPNSDSWSDDVSKGFSIAGIGKRYTEAEVDRLYTALQKKSHKLYCWDTDSFDKLYHNQKDWQSLYQVERAHALEGIAKKIDYCLQQYPQPDNLKIVIASDHGQLMGTSEKLTYSPPELEVKGRMAIGRTDDARFVVLDRDRYGLPHDISVVRGSATNAGFSYTTGEKIIGSHGGLFPEEVVVGVSVLCKTVPRYPVLISCRGEGESQKPGELEISINNTNSVPLTDLCLFVKELPDFISGKVIEQEIPADQSLTIKLAISKVPELPLNYQGDRSSQSNELSLSGELTFRFAGAEAGSATLAPGSAIIVKQMFKSGGINLDDF